MELLRLPAALRRALLSQRSGAFNIASRELSTASPIFTQANTKPSVDGDHGSLDLDDLTPDNVLKSKEQETKPGPSNLSQGTQPHLLPLKTTTLNSYVTTNPPNLDQLRHAESYFHKHPPQILYTSPFFRTIPPSPFPEVAFFGRSNVGKSSVLNALFGRPKEKPAHVSKQPGRTRTMNGFGIGSPPIPKDQGGEKWKAYLPGGLVVVDMPGYGHGSLGVWGQEIQKFITNRKQLRMVYVLLNSDHHPKESDFKLLMLLRNEGVPHQIVMSKVDKILYPKSKAPTQHALHKQLKRLEVKRKEFLYNVDEAAKKEGANRGVMVRDMLCVSSMKSLGYNGGKPKMIGIDELRWSVLTACGMEGVAEERASKKK